MNMQATDDLGNELIKSWNEMNPEQQRAARDSIQSAEQEMLGKITSVSFHAPDSIITAKDGTRYRIHKDGSRRRIEEDED